MVLLASWTVTDVASKVTVQPASHNCPMDKSDEVVRAGTMCTRRADGGRLGKSSLASCVEYMMAPFGLTIPIGRVVGFLLMTAAETEQKCAVLPLSAITLESGGMVARGDLQ